MSSARGAGGEILVVVPARGGSKGLPGKNLRTVAGVSLVGRAVVRGREFALRAGLADRARVVVDTDDEEIAAEGRRWGGEVPFLRPGELAADDTSTEASVTHLLERLSHRSGAVVLLQPTSPLCLGTDVGACWREFAEGGGSSVVSVVRSPHPLGLALTLDASGRIAWALGKEPTAARRQAHEATWWPSGAVYVVDSAWFLHRRTFVAAGETVGVPLPPARSVDVDDRAGLEAARVGALRPRVDVAARSATGAADRGPDWMDEATVLDAAGTLEGTVERVLRRFAEGGTVGGVRFRASDGSRWTLVEQIPAVQSMFGLPTAWEAVGTPRAEDAVAVTLGAEPLGDEAFALRRDDVERIMSLGRR